MGKKNVVSIEDRIPALKQKRKKKANRRLIFYLLLFFLLISIIVYLQSPLSEVKALNISGNSYLEDDKVMEISGIHTGENIWTIGKTEAVQALEKNPVIQKVTINRKLPWTIDITVKEANLVGYVKHDGDTQPMLGNGELLKNTEGVTLSDGGPLLEGFSNDDHLEQMVEELSNLSNDILKLISEIHWEPTDSNKDHIILYMNDGYMVDSTIKDFANNMSVYPSVVKQLNSDDKGIIHIGAGVYFESFNSSEESNKEKPDG